MDIWWAYRTTNGHYGVSRGSNLSQNEAALPIGGANSLGDLISKFPTKIWEQLAALGMPKKLQPALVFQFDHGAVLRNPNYVEVVPPDPKLGRNAPPTVKSNASTAPGSEANPTNIIPSPIPPSVGNSNIGQQFAFLNVFGNVSFWKGLGLVIAGALILVFAALEFKQLSLG